MSNFRKFTIISFCLILLMPVLARAEAERESCQLCGMWIDQYQRTVGELVHSDGKIEHTCGVACLLRIVQEKGVSSFRSIRVKDWNKGTVVDAQDAWYSIGSLLIPDMLPNYIAFADRKDAEAFASEKGGTVLSFVGAMDTISPRGQTQPFRIRQAVTPGQGTLGLGIAYGYMLKDGVKIGTDGQNPESFINNNPAQPRAPKKMEVQTQSLIVNYGITDRLAMQMNLPYFERSMDSLVRQGNRVNTVTAKDDGIGDLAGEVRYNLWRSVFYDKFFTLLAGVTLPTGDFDSTRAFNAALKTDLISTAPGMQQGTGTPTYLGGLLYSHKWESFWFHGQAVYRASPKNSNDYKFGDEYQGGIAVHYTPHYDIMLGLEMDVSETMKNEDRGIEIGNTGGTRSNLAFVFDWRFLNAFGGNLNLRGSVGLPIYEDLNSQDFVNAAGKTYTQAQLGEGFFASLVINFNTRFGQY